MESCEQRIILRALSGVRRHAPSSWSNPDKQGCGRMAILSLLTQPPLWPPSWLSLLFLPMTACISNIKASDSRLPGWTEEQRLSRSSEDRWHETQTAEASSLIYWAGFSLTDRKPEVSPLLSPKEEKCCRIHRFMFSLVLIRDVNLQDKWPLWNLSKHKCLSKRTGAPVHLEQMLPGSGKDSSTNLIGFSVSQMWDNCGYDFEHSMETNLMNYFMWVYMHVYIVILSLLFL